MSHQRKHDRDDKRDRWEAQRWQEQRDEADKPPPEPEEQEPVNTFH